MKFIKKLSSFLGNKLILVDCFLVLSIRKLTYDIEKPKKRIKKKEHILQFVNKCDIYFIL